ncbi:Tigger transposable element-derived protein 6 [Dictyocoela muelleri]|nr:Tigger transposable element-derived protein 6 [Dictyocoela muelleri]
MNLTIFKKWLDDLNITMMKQNRKILLILDNALVHPVGLEFSNLEFFYFPPGVTSKIQPLDQSIIKTLKTYYKKNLNAKINLEQDISSEKLHKDLIKRFRLVDSLKLILES